MRLTQHDVDKMAVSERHNPETGIQRGSVLQRERIRVVAEQYAAEFSGDIIEIGCYVGGTSLILADVARRYGRKLICIDSWPTGTEYNLEEIERLFRVNMEPHADVCSIHKLDAHSDEGIELITSGKYCFAFSDDGHSFDDHKADLAALIPVTTGIICVDDVYLPEVRDAIAWAASEFKWTAMYGDGLREAWLQP